VTSNRGKGRGLYKLTPVKLETRRLKKKVLGNEVGEALASQRYGEGSSTLVVLYF